MSCGQHSMNEASEPIATARIDPTKVEPIPVRFWWLKRILIVSGVMFAGLIALRAWCGWEVDRRLQAEITKCIAAGEPIYPEDFDQEPVPDDKNAAKMLKDAAAALSRLTVPQKRLNMAILDDFSLVDDYTEELQKLVEANVETLRLVRAARDAPGAYWDIRIRRPVFLNNSNLAPRLGEDHRLAEVLSLAIAYYHATGDDKEAIETLRDAFAHADTVKMRPLLISNRAATAVSAQYARSVESLMANLRIEGADSNADNAARPASRKHVRELISDLLDKRRIEESLKRGLWGERMRWLDQGTQGLAGYAWMAGPGPKPAAMLAWVRVAAYPTRPIAALETLRILRQNTAIANVVGLPYQQAIAETVFEAPGDSLLDRLAFPFGGFVRIFAPSFRVNFVFTYRTCAMAQMAGIALAIRLYELDHGRRPQQLSELIPEYLTELPPDPFGDGRATYIHHPDADPPVLYSIGSNATDDGGMVMPRLIIGGDILFFLDGKRPSRAELQARSDARSSQTADDDYSTQNDTGKGEKNHPGEGQP